MASIKEVKAKAQDFVNKGKYDKAVILYTKIMEKLQEKGNPDISLYNKVGDIYLDKLDNSELAIGNYTTAMTMYGKYGLYPNAIAMAKKIIKIDNTQIEMYEKIGEFNKAQGLIGEALNNFVLFAERSIKINDKKSAIRAFKETLDMMPGKVEIKEKLVDLYIQEENYDQAVELLKEVESHYIKVNSMEQAAMIRQKITRYAKHTANPEPAPQPAKPPAAPQPNEDIEIEDFDISDLVDDLTKELDNSFQETEPSESSSIPSQLDMDPTISESSETIPDLNVSEHNESISEINGIDTSESEGDFSYENYVELAKLQEELDLNEAVQSYYQGADGYLSINNNSNALRVYKRIVEIKSDEIKAHKAIIDIAGKMGDPSTAENSYLYIANAYKTKDISKTLQLIDTILSFNPNNIEAVKMKESILGKPEKPAPKPVEKPSPVAPSTPENGLTADDFLNEFKSEITEGLSGTDLFHEAEHVTAKDIVSGKNEGSNKPKFKIEDDKPISGDGDVWSLNELLDELKEGLNESLSDEDVSSHYDLGLSFKEMGLFDMALDEFNKSVKNKDFEFKSLEMLAQCYLEKDDLKKAENIIKRAFKIKGKEEIEYLGVKHTLAVLYDKRKKFKEALKLLNEIKAIEPSFRGIDKHMKCIEEAIASQNAKKSVKSKESDDQYIDFSSFLTEENIDESLAEIDNIEIDLDDDNEDNNKTKNISYM